MHNSNYKLIFSKDSINFLGVINNKERYINIYPDSDNFNDFGMDAKIYIDVVDKYENKAVHLSGFIGFIEQDAISNGKYKLENLLREFEYIIDNLTLKMEYFFTMLRELKQYRELVGVFGTQEASNILNTIHDITIEYDSSELNKNKNAALETDIFNKSFLRNSQSYFAFKNSHAVLKGLEYEKTGLLSSNITFSSGLKGTPTFNFNFDHYSELPKRISVLIGENGVGKSQILKGIALSIINNTTDIFDGEREENDNRIKVNRLLAFSMDNADESVFPVDVGAESKIWYKNYNLKNNNLKKVSEAILSLARMDEIILNTTRFDIFFKSISNINNFHEIALPLKNSKKKCIYITDLYSYGEENRLNYYRYVDIKKEPIRYIEGKSYPLSSGEMSFLFYCSEICLNIENGTLVLLDEPEVHLHPAFINKFFALLDSLLDSTGSSAIISTHSVYFIREVFKEQVYVLRKKENGNIEVEKPRLSTFGANIGNISYFVFGETGYTDIFLKIRNKILEENIPWSVVYDKYKDDFSINILTQLRNSIDKNYE
ncbi:AAA family ATPase [Providencia alcalifaciens]|uniref:AAA family ATPase n=1 Tax=Providencia alcalifaciens TaxID=126385 RepID=UPI001CC5DC75|nr:AAA family ATPase [Providencia alcalifaciens]CAG9416895.1 hypothetical protein NVI2019_GHJFPKLH_01443 [Providencia alcalifaciens]